MRPHGTFAWNELLTTDPERAKLFFAETLGWTFQFFDLGAPYWVIMAGDRMVGGLGALSAGDLETMESYWLGFIEVHDIDIRYQRAIAFGAIEIRGPHDVPGVGRVAVLRDPTGALIGWMRGAADDK
jgi:predicted enzyme related to lactoylglutathione lyase